MLVRGTNGDADSLNREITTAMGFWDNAIEHLFVGPMIPATVLMMLSATYLIISLLGFLGGDFDVDADMDLGGPDLEGPDFHGPDVDGGDAMPSDWLGGIGAATMRAVNLDRVPLMLWFSTFSVLLWAMTYWLWFDFDQPKLQAAGISGSIAWSAWLTFRNSVLAVIATRFATRPLHRLLQPSRQFHAGTLVGETAIVETSQVDGTFGRAKYATGAAPLLIRIRTGGETIRKGTTVNLVDYDATAKEYIVTATSHSQPG